MNIPVGTFVAQYGNPFCETRLARVDLLTAADQTNHDTPVLVAVHRVN
jgi:hypothetical protein